MKPSPAEEKAILDLAQYKEIAQNLYGFDREAKEFCPTVEQLIATLTSISEIYIDIAETGVNTSFLIDQWSRRIGLKGGLEWCAIFVDQVFWDASDVFGMPDLLPFNTAGSQRIAQKAEGLGLGTIDCHKATAGSIIVYADGHTGKGHVEILQRIGEATYDSIGGNTTDDDEINRAGNQVGIHRNVPWQKYGPVGVAREKRWTRTIVPVPGLFNMYWGPEIAKRHQ